MKTKLFLLMCLVSQLIFSQCPPGDVTIISQAEWDDFLVQYPNCTQINGNLTLSYAIPGPPIPSNFGNLGSLTSISGDLTLNIPYFININPTGLQNLTSVGGKLTVAPFGNITNLNFLSGLTSVGSLDIGNETITQVQGLSNITGALNGGITINGCANLISLNGLQNITSLGGQLSITSNAQLTDLTGLEGLTAVNNSVSGANYTLWLFNNTNLISLNGLQNITLLTASNLPNTTSGFAIWSHPNLTNMSALSNITNTLDLISITNNTQLTSCAITPICSKLASTTTGITINNNGTGCESIQVVQAACEALSINGFDLAQLSVYPIPFQNEINIQLNETFGQTWIRIVDLTGKVLLQRSANEKLIQINGLDVLSKGVYILQLEIKGVVHSQKILK